MAELPPDDREEAREWIRKTREKLARDEAEKNKNKHAKGDGAQPPEQDGEKALRQLRVDIGQLNKASTPEAVVAIIERISACAPDEISRDRLLATVKTQTGTGMGALRKQLGRVRAQKRARLQNASPSTPPELSDDALALGFVDQHEDKLRYVALWGKWMIWCGSHWKIEDTLKAFDLARAICRGASAKAPSEDQAAAIASAKTVNAVASLARSDRRVAETVDAWDCDQWTLNTSTGTINTHK